MMNSNDEKIRFVHRTENLLKVAAYIRVSTEHEEQEESFEAQERYFTRLIAEHPGWLSAGIYADYGHSATSWKKRAGFHRLLRHCREARIDRVVCKSISRFARNTRDFVAALKLLTDSGVTIYFEKEGLDTADKGNEFVLTALGAVAQEESRSISENIRWGIEKRYPRGEARNIAIYGYRYVQGQEGLRQTGSGYQFRQICPVEEEAAVVRRIFREAAAGDSHVEIARRLNLENIPSPDSVRAKDKSAKKEGDLFRKGERKDALEQGWTSAQIGRILKLERYTGDILLQKTYKTDFLDEKVRRNKGELPQYLIRDHHPAIITRELYQQVQRQKTGKKSSGQKSQPVRYSFSGVLVCSCCGRFYHTRNRKSNPIWFCPTSALHNGRMLCNAERVYEEQLARMLKKALRCRFPYEKDDFVPALLQKLEQLQQWDTVERDRIFLKKKIADTQAAAAWQNRSEKENTDTCAENSMQEADRFRGRLQYMERYWKELEDTYSCREKAIRWMETLWGEKGYRQFFEEVAKTYVKAFVLSVTVYSPVRYQVRWFDDTRTDVEMSANIQSFRDL